jgi:hypothetical protein
MSQRGTKEVTRSNEPKRAQEKSQGAMSQKGHKRSHKREAQRGTKEVTRERPKEAQERGPKRHKRSHKELHNSVKSTYHSGTSLPVSSLVDVVGPVNS